MSDSRFHATETRNARNGDALVLTRIPETGELHFCRAGDASVVTVIPSGTAILVEKPRGETETATVVHLCNDSRRSGIIFTCNHCELTPFELLPRGLEIRILEIPTKSADGLPETDGGRSREHFYAF